MVDRCVIPGSPMDRPRDNRYAVLRVGEEWRVLYGSSVIGQYRTADAAHAVADKLCLAVADVGRDVELVRHTWSGELRNEQVAART